MRQAAVLAASLVLGVGGGFLGTRLATPPAARTPTADGAPSLRGAGRTDLERLERRIEELSAAVNAPALAPAPAAPTPSPRPEPAAEPSGTPAPSPSLVERLDVLERRIASLEARGGGGAPIPADLTKVPVPQLEALVRTLTAERRGDDAIRVAEEILRRGELTPDQRVDVEMSIGYALRTQGRNAEAEARFRDSLARAGDDTARAPWLLFQIAWERSYQRDLPGASAEMERAANHPRVEPLVRVHALYNAANFAKQSGDTARAQAFLERLLSLPADSIPPSQANMRTQAEAWLKEIRGS
jgi:hypothetical protein